MGIRPNHLTAASVIAVAFVIVGLTVDDASASMPQLRPYGRTTTPPVLRQTATSPPARASCSRPFSSTLLETGKVRVYAMPKESTSPPEHVNPPFFARLVFGCLKTTGRSRLLDLPEADAKEGPLWVEVHPGPFAASGPLVAYVFSQYYTDTHETWIRVRDLRTGAVVRSCLAGGGLAPGRMPHIAEIVLDSRGEVAWSAEGYAGQSIFACGPSGPDRLDQGDGIDLESLSLEHGVVHWLDEGSEREAAFE
jgi:hypothetical protein